MKDSKHITDRSQEWGRKRHTLLCQYGSWLKRQTHVKLARLGRSMFYHSETRGFRPLQMATDPPSCNVLHPIPCYLRVSFYSGSRHLPHVVAMSVDVGSRQCFCQGVVSMHSTTCKPKISPWQLSLDLFDLARYKRTAGWAIACTRREGPQSDIDREGRIHLVDDPAHHL